MYNKEDFANRGDDISYNNIWVDVKQYIYQAYRLGKYRPNQRQQRQILQILLLHEHSIIYYVYITFILAITQDIRCYIWKYIATCQSV